MSASLRRSAPEHDELAVSAEFDTALAAEWDALLADTDANTIFLTSGCCGAPPAARRARFVSDSTGSRLNSRIALPPMMLRFAVSLRNGKS